MNLRFYTATSPGTRHRSGSLFSELTFLKPAKQLTQFSLRSRGHNNRGIITIRNRGGGHKRLYRKITMSRHVEPCRGYVATIEYDPNRTGRIAGVHYENDKIGYILSPQGLKVGQFIVSGINIPTQLGNALPLFRIPLGMEVHNVELKAGTKGVLGRAAGTRLSIVAKEGHQVSLRLPSGEVRIVSNQCWATIGQMGNAEHCNTVRGKAGSTRWADRRPHVRGSAKNPCDHPHGGGEGRTGIGRKQPVTPWGKPALGVLTRPKKKYSDKFRLRGRKS